MDHCEGADASKLPKQRLESEIRSQRVEVSKLYPPGGVDQSAQGMANSRATCRTACPVTLAQHQEMLS